MRKGKLGQMDRERRQREHEKRQRDRKFRAYNESHPSRQLQAAVIDTGMFSYPSRQMAPDDRALIEAFQAKKATEAA